jgi:hypothetical protein
MLTNTDQRLAKPRRSALRPIPPFILIFFAGGFFLKLYGRKRGSPNRLAQPPSSFSYPSISQDYLLFLAYYVGAHPLATDGCRGNVRGSNAYCTLDPPSRPRVHKTPLARTRGVRAGLPYFTKTLDPQYYDHSGLKK